MNYTNLRGMSLSANSGWHLLLQLESSCNLIQTITNKIKQDVSSFHLFGYDYYSKQEAPACFIRIKRAY